MSYWRGSGGSRGAVVSRVTETLRVRKTGSPAEPAGLTWPTVLHGVTTRLVGVRALKNQMVSVHNINFVIAVIKCKRYSQQKRLTEDRDEQQLDIHTHTITRVLTGGQGRATEEPGGQ